MILQIHKLKRLDSFIFKPLRCLALLMFAIIAAFGAVDSSHASDRAFDEYQVKAVFLYRLTLFITWPEKVFMTSNQPFTIGILGDDPFGAHIDRVVRNEKFKGRPILVRRYRSIEEVTDTPCQVLFINQAWRQRWPQVKQTTDAYPTLTVSDMEEFGQMGGMINIKTQVNKIKIEINPDETRKTGLKISSKLLKVSRNVTTTPEGGLR